MGLGRFNYIDDSRQKIDWSIRLKTGDILYIYEKASDFCRKCGTDIATYNHIGRELDNGGIRGGLMRRLIFLAVVVSVAMFLFVGQPRAEEKTFSLPGFAAQIQDAFKTKSLGDEVQIYSNESLQEIFPDFKVCDLFSKDSNDFMVALDMNDDGSKFSFVIYGRLAEGKTFENLQTASEAYPAIDASTYPKIAASKMFVWVIYLNMSSPPPLFKTTYMPYECAEMENNDSTKGQPFKCTHVDNKKFNTNGLSKDELIFLAGEFPFQPMFFYLTPKPWVGTTVQEQIASQCFTFPYTLVNLLYSAKADADANGVPDSYDITSAATGCTDDEDCDEVLDESDLCAGTAADATVDENGCSEAQLAASDTVPSDGALGPAGASGEGGACGMVPTAPFNPMAYLLISAALAALAIRRRR